MKKLIVLACSLAAVIVFCLGAGTVTYTAFFPNIMVYTNAIVGDVWIDGTGAVSMNYDSANVNFGATSDTTILRTSAGTLRISTNLTVRGYVIASSIQENLGVITHAGTSTLDFTPGVCANKLVLTGNVTIAFSNLATNRYYHLLVANAQASNCTYVLPAVNFHGYYPTNIVAGKTAEWWFKVDPQTNSIVYATYVEQQ